MERIRQLTLLEIRKELKAAFQQMQDVKSFQFLEELKAKRVKEDANCPYNDILAQAIIWASKEGYEVGFKKLMELGIDPDYADEYGNTPLILSSEAGHINIVKLVLSHTCDINRTDLETRSGLHWSAMNGHSDIVNLLLERGAIPDMKDKLYGYTPLMLAARQGHLEIVKSLLDKNCDPNKVDINQETALFDAVRNKHIACAKLLLNAGANFNKVDKFGKTLLLAAVLWNRVSLVALLVKLNCKINIPGEIQYQQSRLFQLNINASQQKLFTPIQAALLAKKRDTCKILYFAGAKISFLFQFLYNPPFREFIMKMTGTVEDYDFHWLQEMIENPRTLKECCRSTIREACNSKTSINQLDLPTSLIDYLHVPEVDIYL